MRGITVFVVSILFVLPAEAGRRRAVAQPGPAWDAQLSVSPILATSVAGRPIDSSSQLRVSWTAYSRPVDHYEITATDIADGAVLTFSRSTSPTDLELLESGTDYRIVITACLDASCAVAIRDASTATARTSDEYWQIRGTGSSYATASKVVSDGNTKPWILKWGAEAGPSLAGFSQLYYDPMLAAEKGVKLATSATPVSSSADSIASFTPLSGFGVRRSDAPPSQGTGPATFQIVPMKAGFVRMYYEASGVDGVGRIWSVDSRDGFQGRDFHPGTPTRCEQSDLAAGGPCEAKLLIGVESDGNPRLRQARQFKLLLPTRDTWLWDEAVGTSMIFTAHLTDTTCSPTFFNASFAVWNGSKWVVQYAANGCPKLIPGVQAPMPVHIGGSRYKLYFNRNTGDQSRKPLGLLYSDGIHFENFEPVTRTRDVHVLWPTGIELTEAEESMFDDYHVWMPTGDPSLQVIASNMACPNNACGAPFIGMAVLVNP